MMLIPTKPAARIGLLLGADSLAHRRSGVGRMTLELAQAMHDSPEIATLRLLVNGRIHNPGWLDALPEHTDAGSERRPAPQHIQMSLRGHLGSLPPLRPLRRLIVQARMAAAARELDGDAVYHEPNMITKPFGGATVTTFNDLSWLANPAWHPPDRIAWIERHLDASLRQTTRFVAVSAFTRDAMIRELGIDSRRIDVVPLAPSRVFRPIAAKGAAQVLARHALADRSYVLSVSTLEPRKNFDGLVRAHAALPEALAAAYPLVIAGGHGWHRTLAGPFVDALLQQGRLRLLGHVTDADLVALAARCSAFAYVSHYEGFGLPVLEAMAAGAPVIASATTGTAETAGQAALLVEPEDEAAICAALRRLLEDPALSDRLRLDGQAWAASFSWERTVSRLCQTWLHATGRPVDSLHRV